MSAIDLGFLPVPISAPGAYLHRDGNDVAIVFDTEGARLLAPAGAELPLQVTFGRVRAKVDLANARLTIEAGAFRAGIRVDGFAPAIGVLGLLTVEFTSEPLTLSLARPIDDLLEIVLGPDDPSQPMHLHPEHLDRSLPTGAPVGGQATASTLAERDADRVASVNDVVPAVFVENYKLSLGFTRPRRSAGPVLARIGLVPHESGTRLGITCHAAENEIGGSLTFRAGGASLSVRVGSPNIQDSENIPALVIDAIDLDRDDVAEEIRGAVPGLVGKLRDADELRLAALKVGLDQAGDVARSLGRDARLLVEAQLGVR